MFKPPLPLYVFREWKSMILERVKRLLFGSITSVDVTEVRQNLDPSEQRKLQEIQEVNLSDNRCSDPYENPLKWQIQEGGISKEHTDFSRCIDWLLGSYEDLIRSYTSDKDRNAVVYAHEYLPWEDITISRIQYLSRENAYTQIRLKITFPYGRCERNVTIRNLKNLSHCDALFEEFREIIERNNRESDYPQIEIIEPIIRHNNK